MKAKANAVYEVEDWFGEMQGVTYQEHITNLYNAVNELTKNPTSTIAKVITYTECYSLHRPFRGYI